MAGRRPMPAFAPHAACTASLPKLKVQRLTLDLGLQKSSKNLPANGACAWRQFVGGGILAVGNATGEVLARVAVVRISLMSAAQGQVDMTDTLEHQAPRSSRSFTVWPVEDGIAHPETLIEDRPVGYGAYAPENFDLSFRAR